MNMVLHDNMLGVVRVLYATYKLFTTGRPSNLFVRERKEDRKRVVKNVFFPPTKLKSEIAIFGKDKKQKLEYRNE